jgi:hypothetical protein
MDVSTGKISGVSHTPNDAFPMVAHAQHPTAAAISEYEHAHCARARSDVPTEHHRRCGRHDSCSALERQPPNRTAMSSARNRLRRARHRSTAHVRPLPLERKSAAGAHRRPKYSRIRKGPRPRATHSRHAICARQRCDWFGIIEAPSVRDHVFRIAFETPPMPYYRAAHRASGSGLSSTITRLAGGSLQLEHGLDVPRACQDALATPVATSATYLD